MVVQSSRSGYGPLNLALFNLGIVPWAVSFKGEVKGNSFGIIFGFGLVGRSLQKIKWLKNGPRPSQKMQLDWGTSGNRFSGRNPYRIAEKNRLFVFRVAGFSRCFRESRCSESPHIGFRVIPVDPPSSTSASPADWHSTAWFISPVYGLLDYRISP